MTSDWTLCICFYTTVLTGQMLEKWAACGFFVCELPPAATRLIDDTINAAASFFGKDVAVKQQCVDAKEVSLCMKLCFTAGIQSIEAVRRLVLICRCILDIKTEASIARNCFK